MLVMSKAAISGVCGNGKMVDKSILKEAEWEYWDRVVWRMERGTQLGGRGRIRKEMAMGVYVVEGATRHVRLFIMSVLSAACCSSPLQPQRSRTLGYAKGGRWEDPDCSTNCGEMIQKTNSPEPHRRFASVED